MELRHLTTARLRLDAVVPDDLDEHYALLSDPAGWRHLPSGRHAVPGQTMAAIEQSVGHWQRDGLGYWTARLLVDLAGTPFRSGDVVGTGGCALRTGTTWWNLYYRFTPAAWGHGLAAELVTAALDAARTCWAGSPSTPEAPTQGRDQVTNRVVSRATGSAQPYPGHSGRPSPSAPSEDPMTERLHQSRDSGREAARRRTPRIRTGGRWRARTTPAESEPTILGFPAEFADAADGAAEGSTDPAVPEALPADLALVVVRRADRFAAGALVLAGAAANVSLSLSWLPGGGLTGFSLVRHGVEGVGVGAGEWALTGLWQPLAVVLSGGLLVLLGFLLLVPARAHRFVGVLALAVTLVAATAIVLLMTDVGWGADRLGPGLWCAVAVPILGALGSLKAMLTAPQVILGSG
jgi:RimJ/RimL family protein N-acetyltransferase